MLCVKWNDFIKDIDKYIDRAYLFQDNMDDYEILYINLTDSNMKIIYNNIKRKLFLLYAYFTFKPICRII